MRAIVGVTVRAARPSDRAFILGLIPRLVDFGPSPRQSGRGRAPRQARGALSPSKGAGGLPPWRDAARMTATDTRKVAEILDANDPDTPVFVAEEAGECLGFIELWTVRDYFTDERHGHISNVVVAAGAEGRGAGRALMDAGERWCRERGYRLLTLHVFEHNHRARALYAACGFGVDTIRYAKVIADPRMDRDTADPSD
jgi:ribosomal protein S18 acetylase RimI-like enzyme